MICSPPCSSVVLWVECKPQPVKTAATHRFKAENAPVNIVPVDITSAAVRIVAGAKAGLTLVRPGGRNSHIVSCGAMGTIKPGTSTVPVSVPVQKRPGTSARAEDVRTTISFQAVALPGHRLPPGPGTATLPFAVKVKIA